MHSQENLRLACTNPTQATRSLACVMQVLTSASNYAREKTTRVVNLAVSCTVSIAQPLIKTTQSFPNIATLALKFLEHLVCTVLLKCNVALTRKYFA